MSKLEVAGKYFDKDNSFREIMHRISVLKCTVLVLSWGGQTVNIRI